MTSSVVKRAMLSISRAATVEAVKTHIEASWIILGGNISGGHVQSARLMLTIESKH